MPGRIQPYAMLLCACLCLHGALGHAQEAGAPTAEQPGQQSSDEKLLAKGKTISEQLEQLSKELGELKVSHRDAKGEEKVILASQVRNKRKEFADSLDQLVKHIEDLDGTGKDTTQPRKNASRLLVDAATELKVAIEQAEARIIELLEQRSEAAPEELDALDREIEEFNSAVDEDIASFLEVSRLMQALGIDTAARLEFLDSNIQQRAEHLAGVLRFLNNKRTQIRKSDAALSEEDKLAQADEIAVLDKRIKETAAHLNATVAIMKERELDTAEYTKLLIESTGELTEDIFKTEVALGLLQGWVDSGKDWLLESGPRWFFKIIIFLVILLAFKFLAGIAKRVVRKAVSSSKIELSQLLQNQVISFAGKVVMFLGLLVALSQLGIQLGPLLAGLGIAGFIVGFALQDTLSNFAAGMMILFYRPYDVGDAVEAGGVTGTVKAMTLVSTTIATWDNQRLVVPNSKIWGDVIRNITAEPYRRVDMTFGIAYADDIDHAERVFWEIVKGNERVLEDPEPVVRLHNLGESSVDFVVRPWARTGDYWTVYWDITRMVKKRFDEEGISIPFPQRDVHLIQEQTPAT